MNFRCFWFGCKWGAPMRLISSREWLVQHQCSRCGSFKTEVDDE